MEIQSSRLRKVSDGLALTGRQVVISRKFRKGQAGLQIRLNFFSYDGCFHDSGSHTVHMCGTRKVPQLGHIGRLPR